MSRAVLAGGLTALVLLVGGGLALWWHGHGPGMRAEFALPDIHGQTRHAREWRGKVVVLNFWATWCAPCREEVPMLIEAQTDYADDGLQIVGLAMDERTPVRRFARRYGINYPLLVDANAVAKVQDTLHGGAGLPSTIILDRRGRVRARVTGAMDRDHLDRLLAPLLRPQAPSGTH